VSKRPVIGLFGTDSPKKNYHRLFTAVEEHASARTSYPAIRLYGQLNEYAARITAAFPQLDIAVTDSGIVDLDDFIQSVDLVVSAATREGFGRPMALALAAGVPTWIVDAPVFREFYGDAATFFSSPETLGTAIATLTPGTALTRPTFALPEAATRDFDQCVAWLTAQDDYRS
jgi:glycosyltransferase involved in cell wall biosynthesis